MTSDAFRERMATCTCPHEEGSYGVLYGINMGRGPLRVGTTKGCPVHDTCQGYTKAERAGRPSWGNPYCPIHGTRDCPAQPDDTALSGVSEPSDQ